jgi:hypothetical protein
MGFYVARLYGEGVLRQQGARVKVVDRHKPRGLGVNRIEPSSWQTNALSEEVPVLSFEKTGVETLEFKHVSFVMTIAPGREKGCQNVVFIEIYPRQWLVCDIIITDRIVHRHIRF